MQSFWFKLVILGIHMQLRFVYFNTITDNNILMLSPYGCTYYQQSWYDKSAEGITFQEIYFRGLYNIGLITLTEALK